MDTKLSLTIHWLFLAYFAVLFVERAQSLVRSATSSEVRMFGSGFDVYVNLLAILSLTATVVMLCLPQNHAFFRSLFTTDAAVHAAVDDSFLCITAGVILLSGMVHTEFTVAPVQFGSYGALIVAMILETVALSGKSSDKLLLWFSLAYLILFSMAIPVVYRSAIPNAAVFHVVEAVVSVVMVVLFTWMTRGVFLGEATDLFLIVPLVVAVIGDSVVLYLRRAEEINWFVLIFFALSTVTWVVGKVLSAVRG